MGTERFHQVKEEQRKGTIKRKRSPNGWQWEDSEYEEEANLELKRPMDKAKLVIGPRELNYRKGVREKYGTRRTLRGRGARMVLKILLIKQHCL